MIEITCQKIQAAGLSQRIKTKVADINKVAQLELNQKFDVVFSNFGGLNCLDDIQMQLLSNNLVNILKPHGRFVAILMSDFCLIESLYMTFKLRFNDIFRRKKRQKVFISGSKVNTSYYSPKSFFALFNERFILNRVISVGFTIPPSYLNNFFCKKNFLLKMLNNIEKISGNNSFCASISDHFLIDLTVKK